MSNGQPCSRITGRPSAGPSSAYPILRTPALTCLSDANDVFFGLAGVRAIVCWLASLAEAAAGALLGCALAGASPRSSAATIAIAALLRNPRRSRLGSSGIVVPPLQVMHRAKYYLALKTRHTIPGAAGQRTLLFCPPWCTARLLL